MSDLAKIVAEVEESRRVLAEARERAARAEVALRSALGMGAIGRPRTVSEDRKKLISEALSSGPKTAGELRHICGSIAQQQFSNAIQPLLLAGSVVRIDHGRYALASGAVVLR